MMTKADHYRYLLRELAMIRYDLARLVGDTRDALVRELDTLTCGIETQAEHEDAKDVRIRERLGIEHGERREN